MRDNILSAEYKFNRRISVLYQNIDKRGHCKTLTIVKVNAPPQNGSGAFSLTNSVGAFSLTNVS